MRIRIPHQYERKIYRCHPTQKFADLYEPGTIEVGGTYPNLYQWRMTDHGKTVVVETCADTSPEYNRFRLDKTAERFLDMCNAYVDIHEYLSRIMIRYDIQSKTSRKEFQRNIFSLFTYEEVDDYDEDPHH